MRAFTVSIDCFFPYHPLLLLRTNFKTERPILPPNVTNFTRLGSVRRHLFLLRTRQNRHFSNTKPVLLDDLSDDDGDDFGGEDDDSFYSFVGEEEEISEDGLVIRVKKLGKNSRRIRSRVVVDASLDAVWKILTDYEKLADFIPGLAVSKLIEKKDNFARLYQIGQQNLLFGLKFNAKVVLDCYEKELQSFDSGKKRDIEFKMTEGDFQFFEGKWSIKQSCKPQSEDSNLSVGQGCETTLSYLVDVKPKLWLPVHLVEGRICSEIKTNLLCIREQAQKLIVDTLLNE